VSKPSPGSAGGHLSRTGLGVLLTLAAMLAFALMDGISKVLAGALAIPQILWVRYILFLLLAFLVLRAKGIGTVARSTRPGLQFTRAMVGIVESGVFVLAFKYMPLADVHAIAAASPLIVIALSVPLLGEHVGPRRWLAVAAGFVGVLLIVRPGFEEIGVGHLVALLGAFLWALYQLLVRLVSRHDSSDTTWFWTAMVGVASTSLIGPFVWVWPDAQGWALLIVIALLGAVAHLALIKALSLAEASSLQPYSYTLLMWAAVVGWAVFGDFPDTWTLIGAGVILASGIYAWHRERVRAREAEAAPQV
jgi:drug/metabolite transporter (DMT)-like permease